MTVTNDFPLWNADIPNVIEHLGNKFEVIVNKNVFFDSENDPLTYVANYGASGALPTWIVFDPFTKRFNVHTTDPAEIKTHTIRVTV